MKSVTTFIQYVKCCTTPGFQLACGGVRSIKLITSETLGPQSSQQIGLGEEKMSQCDQLLVIYNLNKPRMIM